MRPVLLLADSAEMFRAGVRGLLERESEFEIAEVRDLFGVLDAIESARPNVALVDLDLPPRGAAVATEHLVRRCATGTIVWSFDPVAERVLDAIRAGASGCLRKDISPDGLVRALRGFAAGEAPLSRDLAALVVHAFQGGAERKRARERAEMLSHREREVLALVAQGAHNRDVAAALGISEFTVKRHMQNILEKLGVHSRSAAASFYQRALEEERPLVASGGTG